MNGEPAHAGTVFVVDDDPKSRKAIEWTLHRTGYHVTTFANATGLLRALELTVPVCVVIDLLLPGMPGLKLCENLKSRVNCSFLMISGHGDVRSAVEAMKLGAVDFLEKPFGRQALLDAVYRALELAKCRLLQFAEEQAVVANLHRLTSRERQIVDCLAEGLVTKQIAARLGISPKTVDVHRSSILRKLDLESLTQLAHVMYLSHRHSERAKKG